MADIEQEELAAHICGISIDDDNEDYENDIDDALLKKFDITLEQFRNITNALFPLLSIGVSPLTNSAMIGFANESGGMWLAKKEINSQFIACLIQWLSEGEDLEMGKGWSKGITNDGNPEYDLTIKRSVYLTLDYLKDEANRGKMIATGVTTNPRLWKEPVRWLAKAGDGWHDWAIYYHTQEKTIEWLMTNGDKVTSESVIRELVPCSDEAYSCYRM